MLGTYIFLYSIIFLILLIFFILGTIVGLKSKYSIKRRLKINE